MLVFRGVLPGSFFFQRVLPLKICPWLPKGKFSCSAMIFQKLCWTSEVEHGYGGSFKHVFGMFIPIQGDHTKTNKKWFALISYKRATTKRPTIEIKSESETNVKLTSTSVIRMLLCFLWGNSFVTGATNFFLAKRRLFWWESKGPPPLPKTPSPHQSVPEKINLLPKRRISLPTPPHFSGANSLLVWGFGSCWLMRKNQMACLSSYRSQVFGWEKATNRCITLGPQQPMEKWRFYTTDIWVITYNP